MANRGHPLPLSSQPPVLRDLSALERSIPRANEKPPSSISEPPENNPPYEKLAQTLMGPIPDMAIMRRFGDLNMVNLMSLQAELLHFQEIFQTFGEVDHKRMTLSDIERSLTQFLDPKNCNRKEHSLISSDLSEQMTLLLKMRGKLKEYNEALLQVSAINALPKPKSSSCYELRRWLSKARDKGLSLKAPEFYAWDIENQEDLISLRKDTDQDGFSKFFSSWVLYAYHALIGRHFRNRDWADADFEVARYSDSRLERASTTITSVIASMLPVLAILILYTFKNTAHRIYITIGLTFLFALAISLFTSAKNHEIFAATSAFAAVEVVFIGSVHGS